MKLSDLRKWTRKYLLIKPTQLTDAEVNTLLNKAKDAVTMHLELNPKDTTFDIAAEKGTYSIATDIASDYLGIRKEGVEWYDGTQWNGLDGITREYLNKEFPNWRNDSSGDPKYNYIEGDNLGLYRIPDTTLEDGGKLFYTGKYTDMSDDEHYPFHIGTSQTTEIPQYSILDDCIFAYIEWKGDKLKSKNDTNTQQAAYKNFLNELKRCSTVINKRLDIHSNKKARYQGMIHT